MVSNVDSTNKRGKHGAKMTEKNIGAKYGEWRVESKEI